MNFRLVHIKLVLLSLTFLLAMMQLSAQEGRNMRILSGKAVSTPEFALKTNLLYDATTTFNLGFEAKLAEKYSLDLSVNYNPWTFSDNKKLKHVLVQPELRYWLFEPFYGHFFGAHLLYSHYNVGNIKLPLGIFSELQDHRYQGDAYGLGVSYGYQWLLSNRWSIEASFGFGYVYTDYKKYNCDNCGSHIANGSNHYFGPTKLGVSLIYIIK